jgi:outer membrane protein
MNGRVTRAGFWTSVFVAVWISGPVSWAADPIKIGVIELQRVFNESKLGQKYKAEFLAKAKEMDEDLKRREKELKTLEETLSQQKVLLSPSAWDVKAREFQDEASRFQKKVAESRQTFQRGTQEVTRRILKELQPLVRDVAESGGYTLILERQEGGVLHALGNINLTDEIIRRYDKIAGD